MCRQILPNTLRVPDDQLSLTIGNGIGQYDFTLTPAVSLSASGRLDFHSEYGTFFSPPVSLLARSGRWTSRGCAGTGFFASTPLTEETEAAGLTRLEAAGPRDVNASVCSVRRAKRM